MLCSFYSYKFKSSLLYYYHFQAWNINEHTAHHYWHNTKTPGLLGSYLLVPSGILALGQSLLQNTGFGTHIQKTQQMKTIKTLTVRRARPRTVIPASALESVVRESAARPLHCATSWSLLVLALHCPTDNTNVQQCHNLYPLFLSLPLTFYAIANTVMLFLYRSLSCLFYWLYGILLDFTHDMFNYSFYELTVKTWGTVCLFI